MGECDKSVDLWDDFIGVVIEDFGLVFVVVDLFVDDVLVLESVFIVFECECELFFVDFEGFCLVVEMVE